MCRATTLAVAASTASLAFAGAAAAAGLGPGGLPGGWTHAEVNVTMNHVPHTISYDRGRVQSVSGSAIALREADGSVVTIPVSGATVVTVDGRPGSLSDLRRGEIAITMRIDGGTAKRVRVRVPARLAGRQG